MKIIGLTGGIGSGKSFVASIFSKLGISIFDSDTRAKELYMESDELRIKMILEFGSDVYTKTGINRQFLANIVFNNESKLKKLNSFVHPLLQQDFDNWVSTQNSLYVIREAAILIESEAYKLCDHIVVVTAPEKVRIERVMTRDNASESEIKTRISNQLSEVEMCSKADFIIRNNGNTSVIEQVLDIHNKLSIPNLSL